ncbi:hypothetical protein TruAng_003224 [Truncatella angustata]|nr:hypothetical protein TruAng_003224 [Truncatella angustata]
MDIIPSSSSAIIARSSTTHHTMAPKVIVPPGPTTTMTADFRVHKHRVFNKIWVWVVTIVIAGELTDLIMRHRSPRHTVEKLNICFLFCAIMTAMYYTYEFGHWAWIKTREHCLDSHDKKEARRKRQEESGIVSDTDSSSSNSS